MRKLLLTRNCFLQSYHLHLQGTAQHLALHFRDSQHSLPRKEQQTHTQHLLRDLYIFQINVTSVTRVAAGRHLTINGSDSETLKYFQYQQCSINMLATNYFLTILTRIQHINKQTFSKESTACF